LGGYVIPAGTFVTVGLGHSNLDPSTFVEPMTFDVCPVRESMNTFGGGRHFCLGSNLARAELQEAFGALAARFPTIELAGEPVWRPPIGIYGPDRLPLRFPGGR
ncbi:MAG: cytochrome P450, partial [Actinobacteria bacterium]|nr:cytochrome P450 [Actinomycetota bacterium]